MNDAVIYESLDDYLADGEKRFGKDARKWVFVCPICEREQTADDLIAAGMPKDKVKNYIGFSCIGRLADKPNSAMFSRKKDIKGKGCDYTLGGLFVFPGVIVKHEGKEWNRFAFAERSENNER